VDEVHLNDSKDRASLKEHLAQLEKLNRQMSEDAVGLTQALKGESKAQGNWGEMILERILETSGLREGKEFAREQSFTNEEGRRLRPDVVIYMPGDKQVIIDSKVSLTDYERVVSASSDAERKKALTAHLKSLKSHIQGLSGKRYDHLPNVNSPDYVLMFVPIEGAYLMAIEEDSSVFESAFEQRVAVVTPSTLYATLKLIEQLWRYERQSENVVKLIDRAGKLHDKFVDFVKAFEEIGQRLDQAQNAYGTALDRIKDGRGSVISQISTLGKLAGKTKKELPKHLTESASISDQTDKS
jgi:DNA recombination protein RmuC